MTERETNRQMHTQRERETEGERETKGERDRDRQRKILTERDSDRYQEKHKEKYNNHMLYHVTWILARRLISWNVRTTQHKIMC